MNPSSFRASFETLTEENVLPSSTNRGIKADNSLPKLNSKSMYGDSLRRDISPRINERAPYSTLQKSKQDNFSDDETHFGHKPGANSKVNFIRIFFSFLNRMSSC
jgi:hypothetical protein